MIPHSCVSIKLHRSSLKNKKKSSKKLCAYEVDLPKEKTTACGVAGSRNRSGRNFSGSLKRLGSRLTAYMLHFRSVFLGMLNPIKVVSCNDICPNVTGARLTTRVTSSMNARVRGILFLSSRVTWGLVSQMPRISAQIFSWYSG